VRCGAQFISLRTSYKISREVKLTFSVGGQGDASSSGLINLGLQGTLGGLYTF